MVRKGYVSPALAAAALHPARIDVQVV